MTSSQFNMLDFSTVGGTLKEIGLKISPHMSACFFLIYLMVAKLIFLSVQHWVEMPKVSPRTGSTRTALRVMLCPVVRRRAILCRGGSHANVATTTLRLELVFLYGAVLCSVQALACSESVQAWYFT